MHRYKFHNASMSFSCANLISLKKEEEEEAENQSCFFVNNIIIWKFDLYHLHTVITTTIYHDNINILAKEDFCI